MGLPLPPRAPGKLTKAILELTLVLPPEEAGSLLCVHQMWRLESPSPGTSAWGPAWVTQDPQSPSCFQMAEGGELRWLYSLPGPGEWLGHDHGHTRPGPEAFDQAFGGGGAPAGDAAVAAEGRAAVHAVLAARRVLPCACPPLYSDTTSALSAPRPG